MVSEDCLYLTLATPALDGENILTNASLPVMVAPRSSHGQVWIHGGSWTTGSGGPVVYNPDLFMDKVATETGHCQGVVHVGVNYRLGALGFLALEGETGGNQGLRDQVGAQPQARSPQVMALHWMRDNIRGFGGDPSKVTMYGESAGSWSVFLQSVSVNP